MSEIDPVKFGELCAEVKNNNHRLQEIGEKMDAFVEATHTRFVAHEEKINGIEKDTAVKKGAIIGMLGAGTVAGMTLPEGVKKILEAIGKAFS